MIYKFIDMLYQMYGNGYEDLIESFADQIDSDLGLDELFIEWAQYLKK